jgi:hypothetical protein
MAAHPWMPVAARWMRHSALHGPIRRVAIQRRGARSDGPQPVMRSQNQMVAAPPTTPRMRKPAST